MIDILQKLYDGEITEERAYEIYDEVMDKHDRGELKEDPPGELHMDNYEWTAFAHGAYFAKLAKWRKEGWPTRCNKCNALIEYKKYGWTIDHDELVCLDCSD